MIVIIGRVTLYTVEDGCRHLTLDSVQIILIGTKRFLLIIGQSVVSHILQRARSTGSGKSIGDGRLRRNLSPLGCRKTVAAIHRHTTLIEFLSVTEDILTDISQVDIQIATITAGLVGIPGIDKRIEQPELYILNIGSLEVAGIQLPHHTAPSPLRVRQCTITIQVHIQIIRTTLTGVIRQIQDRQGSSGSIIITLVTIRVKFLHVYLSHIVVGELVKITLDMTGREG